jgi:hypothetical protein
MYNAFGSGTTLSDVNGSTVTLGSNTVTLAAMSIGTATPGAFTAQANANSAAGNWNIPNTTASSLFEAANVGTSGAATGEIFYFPGNDNVGGNPTADIQGSHGLASYFTLNGNGEITFTVVPEPSTYAALIGIAALGYALLRRRRSIA